MWGDARAHGEPLVQRVGEVGHDDEPFVFGRGGGHGAEGWDEGSGREERAGEKTGKHWGSWWGRGGDGWYVCGDGHVGRADVVGSEARLGLSPVCGVGGGR